MKFKVNVIAPLYEDWILTKIAKMLDKYIPEVILSEKPDPKADINHFVNYALYKPVRTKTSAWFTHPEGTFWEMAKHIDWCICHAERYAEQLREKGYRATAITPGIDDIFKPKLVLGVVGKKRRSGRKGDILVEQIKKLDFVQLKFTHSSWEGDDIPFNKLPDFYNSIDYLLVPSILEGGPIPVGEAIKSGKKVISPLDVGNVNLFKENIIFYKKGNIKSLIKVLDKSYKSKLEISNTVKHLTWENFALKHQNIFEHLSGK